MAEATSRRPGTSVPGYTGYIPGKRPETDIVGTTFATSNRALMGSPRTTGGPLGDTPRVEIGGDAAARAAARAAPRSSGGFAPPPRVSPRAGQLVPGYTGYIPGKRPEADVLGRTFANINDHVANGPKERPRPNFIPDHEKLQASREAPGAGHAVIATVGYRGYVPGKKAENIVGRAYAAANLEAAKEFYSLTHRGESTKHNWKRPDGPEVASRCGSGAAPGKTIPGYCGYIPGKHPEADNMAKTFAAANMHGDRIHKYNKGHVPRDERMTTGTRSTCSGVSDASRSHAGGSGGQRPRTAPSEVSAASSRRSARSERSYAARSAATASEATVPADTSSRTASWSTTTPQQSPPSINSSRSGTAMMSSGRRSPQSGAGSGGRR